MHSLKDWSSMVEVPTFSKLYGLSKAGIRVYLCCVRSSHKARCNMCVRPGSSHDLDDAYEIVHEGGLFSDLLI